MVDPHRGGGKHPGERTEAAHVQIVRVRGMRSRAGGMLLFGRIDEDRNAHGSAAIRIRTCRSRSEDIGGADLQDALRARGPCRRFHGDLRLERIRTADGGGETGPAGRPARRRRIENGDARTSLRSQPGLCRTHQGTAAAPGQEAANVPTCRPVYGGRRSGPAARPDRTGAIVLAAAADTTFALAAGDNARALKSTGNWDRRAPLDTSWSGSLNRRPFARSGRLAQRESVPFTRERS